MVSRIMHAWGLRACMLPVSDRLDPLPIPPAVLAQSSSGAASKHYLSTPHGHLEDAFSSGQYYSKLFCSWHFAWPSPFYQFCPYGPYACARCIFASN